MVVLLSSLFAEMARKIVSAIDVPWVSSLPLGASPVATPGKRKSHEVAVFRLHGGIDQADNGVFAVRRRFGS